MRSFLSKIQAADDKDTIKTIGALLVLVDEMRHGVTADDILSDMFFDAKNHSQNHEHINNLKAALPKLEKLMSDLQRDINKKAVTLKIG